MPLNLLVGSRRMMPPYVFFRVDDGEDPRQPSRWNYVVMDAENDGPAPVRQSGLEMETFLRFEKAKLV